MSVHLGRGIDKMKTGELKTVNCFLNELKLLNNQASDYRLAQILGVKNQTVYKWRAGQTIFDDEMCLIVASMLNYKPGYVMACAHAERAKDEAIRQAWESVAASFLRLAA